MLPTKVQSFERWETILTTSDSEPYLLQVKQHLPRVSPGPLPHGPTLHIHFLPQPQLDLPKIPTSSLANFLSPRINCFNLSTNLYFYRWYWGGCWWSSLPGRLFPRRSPWSGLLITFPWTVSLLPLLFLWRLFLIFKESEELLLWICFRGKSSLQRILKKRAIIKQMYRDDN